MKKFHKIMSFFMIILILLNTGIEIYAQSITIEEDKVSDLIEEEIEKEKQADQENLLEDRQEVESNEEVKDDLDKVLEVQEEVEDKKETKEDKKEVKEEIKKEEAKEEISEEVGNEEKPIILTAKLREVTITISAEAGLLKRDITLHVKELSDKQSKDYAQVVKDNTEHSLENFKAFDISLLDSDKNEIQPQGQVEVSFLGVDFVKDSEELVAYHLQTKSLNGENEISSLTDNIKVNELEVETGNGELSFTTDHFSIYAIGTKPTATYTFQVDGSEIDSQIVLDGEYLKEPKTPAKQEGKKFVGWYIDGGEKIDFSNPVTVGQSVTYKVNAKFEDIYYIYFKYDDNIVKTKEVKPGEKTNENDVPIVIREEGKTLDYWSEIPGGPPFNFAKPITKNITLYAVLADRWKVTFDSQGGTSLLPKYIESGKALGELQTPTRAGYSFQGWYSGINGTGMRYTNTSIINNKTSLYANWKAETVNYSIIYWQENADDANYTYKETKISSGVVGSTITLPANDITSSRYDYFSYDKYDRGKTIKGDGTTVVNVYYSRNSYTLKFDLKKTGSTIVIGGKTYTGSSYQFTAKYESDISDLWPTADNIKDVKSDKFTSWASTSPSSTQASKVLVLTSNYISTTGTKTYTGNWSSSVIAYKLHYMIERLDGEIPKAGDKEYVSGSNKKWYSEDQAYRQTVNYAASTTWGAKQLPGVKNVGIQQANKDGDVYFYYDRNSYNLNFYNPTLLDKTYNLKYGLSIENQNYTPPRPSGINKDYVFKGWYTNPEGAGNPFNFTGAKMPENNLALYAKWTPAEYSVKYYVKQDDGGEIKEVEHILDGDKIDINTLSKEIPDGLSEEDFIGWYWYIDGIFVPYDFNTPVINNNYVLYPVWRNVVYTLKYDKGLGSGQVPLDSNKYYLGASANVLEPAKLIAPKGKFFIGWKRDASNKTYYPNDKVNITGNIILTAQWGETIPQASLTYKANGGLGEDQLIKLKNNSTHQVLANIFSRENYQFIGWNTEADGSGQGFRERDEIIVGSGEPLPNILYAQWIEKIDISVEKVWKGDEDYPSKRPEYIEVQLVKNGEDFGPPIQISLDKNWKHIYKSLDRISEVGEENNYSIREISTRDYKTEIIGDQNQGFTITNTLKRASLEIVKVDGKTGEKITSGAEFELLDGEGKLIESAKTGKDGTYKFDNLALGKYKLIETKAPTYIDVEGKEKSYKLLSKAIEVEINVDGQAEELIVKNYKSNWILPATGGRGPAIHYGMGTIFIFLSIILRADKKRGKKHVNQ